MLSRPLADVHRDPQPKRSSTPQITALTATPVGGFLKGCDDGILLAFRAAMAIVLKSPEEAAQ